ncbi:MAG: hypothetical protein NHB32_22715 [Fischerella sp. CENA71]|nr:hypothetical protein [Fischerella sp. CENA71]
MAIASQYGSDKTNRLTSKHCRDVPWHVSTFPNHDEKFLTEPYWIASFLDTEALGFADCKPGRGQ